MDLLSFEGKKAFIDLSASAALIAAVEVNISIRLDEEAIYKSIFRSITDLEDFDRKKLKCLIDIPFHAGIDDDDINLCTKDQINLFRNICLEIAKSLSHQLLDNGFYVNGKLLWYYRGKLSSNTGVLFELELPKNAATKRHC